MTARLLLLGLAALALSACGKAGALERPGPMWGPGSGADAGPEPGSTVRTVDPRNPNQEPDASRASGAEGAAPTR
jgi:hypothetical protein